MPPHRPPSIHILLLARWHLRARVAPFSEARWALLLQKDLRMKLSDLAHRHLEDGHEGEALGQLTQCDFGIHGLFAADPEHQAH